MKQNLAEIMISHNQTVRDDKVYRSYGMETKYDMKSFVAPFDIFFLDNEISVQKGQQ